MRIGAVSRMVQPALRKTLWPCEVLNLRGSIMLYILALLIGVIAGLRATTAPATVAWGAWLGWLPLAGTWAGFMGHWIAVGIFTILALVELITDQLPSTPSRK